GVAGGEAQEHLELPLRETRYPGLFSAVDLLQCEPVRKADIEVALACSDRRDRLDQRFRGAALRQESARPLAQSAASVLGVFVRRERQHAGLGIVGADAPQRLES